MPVRHRAHSSTDRKAVAMRVGVPSDLFELDDEDYAVVKADPVPADQEELAEARRR